jgi:hypothetical protein
LHTPKTAFFTAAQTTEEVKHGSISAFTLALENKSGGDARIMTTRYIQQLSYQEWLRNWIVVGRIGTTKYLITDQFAPRKCNQRRYKNAFRMHTEFHHSLTTGGREDKVLAYLFLSQQSYKPTKKHPIAPH